jgi:protein-S-isoprenylcysteine O-methyltransferase Ste14
MLEELIFRYVLLLVFILFLATRGYFGRKAKPPGQKRTRQERWTEQVKYESKRLVILRIITVYAIIVFIFIWSLVPFLLPFWTQFLVPSWIRWVGLLINILMIVAMIWVGIHLGKQVSGTLEIKIKHQLIMSGPYKYIRHPMYLVYLFFNFGMMLVCANLIIIIIIIIGILVLIPRMRVEEEMMFEQFGDEYRKYMQRTGRLFPPLRQKKEDRKP